MENNSSNAPLVEKVVVLSVCFLISYMIIRHIWSSMKMEKEPIVVLITGAAGEVSYAVIPMIAGGITFGLDQPVLLHLLDIEPEVKALRAVEMEVQDSAFPLLKGVVVTTDLVEACKDVNIAIILEEGYPTESKDHSYYKAQIEALGEHAAEDCKILVVPNPSSNSNTNIGLILMEISSSSNISNIPAKNITSLTRLHHNRALSIISNKLDVPVSDVNNVIIWGNNSSSSTQNQYYPDLSHALVATTSGQKRIRDAQNAGSLLDKDFIAAVQQRGAAAARRKSSALSTATAISDHFHDWVLGTPKGKWVSMGVCSDGSYGIQPGLFYSFPVTCKHGHWNIVQGLENSEFSREKIDVK